MATTLHHWKNGAPFDGTGGRFSDVTNPATGEVSGQLPLASEADVNEVIAAAAAAFPKWRDTSLAKRTQVLFAFRELLNARKSELAAIITSEHGKNLSDAQGEVTRGLEVVDFACGMPHLLKGSFSEGVSTRVDVYSLRQPLGVAAIISPFNFPAMVPCWFWPYAIATGNTFILKPSEQVPFSSTRILELAQEAGIPAGVLNMVHGAKDVVNALLAHPGIVGISFVGSSPVAKYVYQEAAKYGKRVQALGGAKNHVIVMPDADMDRAVANVSESLFGCAGQRCLAGSVVVTAGKAYEPFRDKLLSAAKDLRLGYGLEPGVTMGPVISAKHKEKVLSYVEAGRKDGATLLLDGRATKVDKHPRGHFIGPTVFDGVQPDMTIGKEEIFGPVASVTHVSNLDEGIAMVQRSGFANATSIFTQSGRAAREFRYRVGVSMIGVNIGVAAPMAFFPFGGTKGSFFGDLKAHGHDSIEFYTDKKVVISRW